jgi:hypothetical protein
VMSDCDCLECSRKWMSGSSCQGEADASAPGEGLPATGSPITRVTYHKARITNTNYYVS